MDSLRFGKLGHGLTNFGRSQVGHDEKEESVCRNMQIEINETVSKKAETSDKA